jgi:hypothetical protein
MTIIRRNKPGIDRAVRRVVEDLNRNGYHTVGSCAGHYKSHRGFITISPHKDELKQQIAVSPELKDWYIRSGDNYGDRYDVIGFSSRPIDPLSIQKIFKKHHIFPVYHEKPRIYLLKNGRLNEKADQLFVHAFTFPPQEVDQK